MIQPLPPLQSQGNAFTLALAGWGLVVQLHMYLLAFRLLWSAHSSLQQLLSCRLQSSRVKKPSTEDPGPCGPGRKCAVIERIIHVRCTQAEEVAKELNEKKNPNKHGILILRSNSHITYCLKAKVMLPNILSQVCNAWPLQHNKQALFNTFHVNKDVSITRATSDIHKATA